MILLATNKRDVTTDFVVQEMRRREIAFFRLNTEDIGDFQIDMIDGNPAIMRLTRASEALDLCKITAAYYRRPGRPEFAETDEAIVSYLTAEWSAVLRSMWNALEGRWLNSPFSILRAEDKPRQLKLARQAGLSVPATLVSNNFSTLHEFSSSDSTVVKPLRHALIEKGNRGSVVFTSQLVGLDETDCEAINRAPIIAQTEIRKRCDIRVIVVDDNLFATAIGSQDHEETQTDWRRGVRTDLSHDSIKLPKNIELSCLSVVKLLGLRFAAIDLIEDLEGHYWFLEANPNGQWAWIEQKTAAPISAAIVDGLAR